MPFLVFFVIYIMLRPVWGREIIVAVGDSTELNCTSWDLSVTRWEKRHHGVIFSSSRLHPRFSSSRFNVTFSAEQSLSRLLIGNVRPSDAGVYICSVLTVKTEITLNITVPYGNVACTRIGQSIHLNCSSWSASDVIWYWKTAETADSVTIYDGFGVSANFSSRFNVTFSANEQLSHLTIREIQHDDAGLYTCATRTDSETMFLSWLNITDKYGAENIQIHKPQQRFFGHGDKLNCSAESSPPPVYYWIVGESVVHGQQYVINICHFSSNQQPKEFAAGGSVEQYTVTVTCVAQVERQNSSTSVDMDIIVTETDSKQCGYVSSRGDEDGNNVVPVAVCVVTAVLVGIIAFVAGILCRNRRVKECRCVENEHSNQQEETPTDGAPDAGHYVEIIDQQTAYDQVQMSTVVPLCIGNSSGSSDEAANSVSAAQPTAASDDVLATKLYEGLDARSVEPQRTPVYSRIRRSARQH